MTVRLLLTDDDEVDRLTVRRHLASFETNIEIVDAGDAQSAVRLARSEPFDCLIVDMNMPGRDGLWVVTELRCANVTVPIIVLTGHGDEETAVSVMKAGATDYISKATLTAVLLRQRVRQALRIGRAESETAAARRAQEETERLLRLIIDSLPVLVAYVDHERTYRWTNLHFEDWFGRRRDLLNGQPVASLLGPEAYEAIRSHIEVALSGRAVTFEQEVPFESGKKWVEATYVPHVAGGGARGYVELVRDVSVRREQQHQLSRQREFEQELVGIVSHDLRNPISVMMLAAKVLLGRTDLPEGMAATLAKIESNGDRAIRMIRDLLDFTQARLGAGIPVVRAAVDLTVLARQVIEEMRISRPGRQFVLASRGDTHGEWDPDRLLQIFTNLLTNAATYSPPSSPVEVTIDGEGTKVRVTVFNAGEPIPPDVLPVVFQPFKRGRNVTSAERSIGLGLYIVEQLVNAHGGTIEVASLAHVGTTFAVTLPRAGREGEQLGAPFPAATAGSEP